MIELHKIYRIFHASKISSVRLLLYVLFGYAASGYFISFDFLFVPALINLMIVFFGIVSASLANDYYDFERLGEENAIGPHLERQVLNHKAVQALIWAPWILSLFLFFVLLKYPVTPASLVLLWASFILSVLYNYPPMRWKERAFVGVITPPIGIFFLFLQAYVLFKYPAGFEWVIVAIVFLYAWYIEFLHLVDDANADSEIHKISKDWARKGLILVSIVGTIAAIIATYFNILFLISAIGWALRLFVVTRSSDEEIIRARRDIFHPVWMIWEFVLYTLIGALFLIGYVYL
jgi:hypothetical protein